MPLVSELRAAARPFVARSLRGPRLKRSLALAALLALVTCVLGAWLALGDGEVERETRQALRLEKSQHELMYEDHVYVARDDWHYRQLLEERDALVGASHVDLGTGGGPLVHMAARGYETVRAAISVPAVTPQHAELRARARDVLDRHAHWSVTTVVGRVSAFDWTRPDDVERLAAIVDHDLVPEVLIYHSPLDRREAVGLVGLIAGLLLTSLLTVVAPVLVGIAVAQEAHENTLQPLTGTSLSPRQIAIGMLLGPAAPVLLLAVPQVAIVTTAAMIVGRPLPVLVFFALLVPCAWVLATLAQVVGLHAGKRRGPGIIGMTLLGLAGTWTLVGWVLGFGPAFTQSKAAVMAVLPSGAIAHFLREGFVGEVVHPAYAVAPVDPWWFAGRLVATIVACSVLGALALLATERRIFGRFRAPLRRGEAMIGVAVLALLTLLAAPQHPTEAWLATLAVIVMPMQILIMARVPVGDAPEGTARVQTGALLAEFAAFVAIHSAFALALVGHKWLFDLGPAAILQLGWALAVAALVSIRVVARPARLPALVWAGFAYVLAIITFATGIASVVSNTPWYHGGTVAWFVLWEASPVLGLAQAALTLAIPVLFVRALQRPASTDALAKDAV